MSPRPKKPTSHRYLSFFRKFGIGVLWFFLLTVLLVISLYFLLQRMFPPEKLSPIVASELQRVLHRGVTVDSVRWVNLQGLLVSDLKVWDREGFGEEAFVTCRRVVAKPRWRSLLRGHLELKELQFWSPAIRIVRSKEGVWNVADLGQGRRRAVPLIRHVEIQDGELLILDKGRGSLRKVSNLDFRLWIPGGRQRIPFRLAFQFRHDRGGKSLSGEVEARGRIEAGAGDWASANTVLERVRVQLPGLQLETSGTVSRPTAPILNLEWKTGSFEPNALASSFPSLAPLNLPPSAGKLHLALEADRRLDFRHFEANVGGLSLYAKGRLDLFTSTPTLRLRLSTNRFPIHEAARVWSPLLPYDWKGEAKLTGTLDGPVRGMGLEEILVSLHQTGFRHGSLEVAGLDLNLHLFSNLEKAALRIGGGHLVHHGQHLENLKTTAKLANDVLDIEGFTTSWNGFPMKLRAEISPPFAPKKILIDGDLDRFQLEELIRWIRAVIEARSKEPPRPGRLAKLGWLRIFKRALPKEFPALQGDIRAIELAHPNWTGVDLRVVWNLDGLTRGLKELTGNVVIDVKNGRVHDLPALMKHKFLYFVFLPFHTVDELNKKAFFRPATPGDLAYQRIHANYRFHNGSMLIHHFFVHGNEITATAQGEVDWTQERLLLHVITRSNQQGNCPEHLSDEKGRCTLPFFIEGPMLHPTIRLDLEKVKAGEIERFMESGLAESGRWIERLKGKIVVE